MTVYFTGEHASKGYNGYVHGAYLQGIIIIPYSHIFVSAMSMEPTCKLHKFSITCIVRSRPNHKPVETSLICNLVV